ncbi:MAG: site-specific integrase [Cyclobacteriaceae bacterium]
MAQITFRLNHQKKNKKGELPIVLDITFNNERIRKSTGKKALEKHWNERHMRVRSNLKSEPQNHYEIINKKLDELEKKANDIINEAIFNNRLLSADYFESKWEEQIPKNPKGKSFVEYLERFIEVEKPVKAKRTIMGHTTALNFMKNYSKDRGILITLDSFDFDVFEGLREYAYGVQGITDNTFSTIFKRYKTFMNWALLKGYHNNTKYKSFKTPERPTEIICLYERELFHLYNYKFETERLERVRDTYCFGCFTGLRFSDITDLKREHLVNDEIQKVIVKTREFQRIPLNKYATEILEKYKDFAQPLPRISEQKFNQYIKEACKEAKIDQPVTVTKYAGREAITKTVPKHELITSHTARKTFTTNSLIFGMHESVVKKITGHKKDEHFKKYVNLAESYISEQAKTAWDR